MTRAQAERLVTKVMLREQRLIAAIQELIHKSDSRIWGALHEYANNALTDMANASTRIHYLRDQLEEK